MRTLQQFTLITPTEPIELVVLEYWQDQVEDSGLCSSAQVIPVTALKIETYEQSYQNSSSTDLITQTKYISPTDEVNVDAFSMIQPIRPDNTLACMSIIALRTRGSDQVCILEPSISNKNWLEHCSLTINPNQYITHSSGEIHPVLVDLNKLREDLELTFSAVTEFTQKVLP